MATDAVTPARPITLWSQVKVLAASPMAPFYFIVTSVAVLVGVGFLMVLSASSVVAQVEKGDPYYYTVRHFGFLVAGVVAALILSRLKPAVPKLVICAVTLAALPAPTFAGSAGPRGRWPWGC